MDNDFLRKEFFKKSFNQFNPQYSTNKLHLIKSLVTNAIWSIFIPHLSILILKFQAGILQDRLHRTAGSSYIVTMVYIM